MLIAIALLQFLNIHLWYDLIFESYFITLQSMQRKLMFQIIILKQVKNNQIKEISHKLILLSIEILILSLSYSPPPPQLEFWDVVQASQHCYWRGAGLPSCPPQTADRGQCRRVMEDYDIIIVCAFAINETFKYFSFFFCFASLLLSAYLIFWNCV